MALILTILGIFTVQTAARPPNINNPEAASQSLADAPDLGTATFFSVLGASTVTNTGPSTLTGNLGVSPGTAITGFPPGTVTGTIHAGNAVAAQAQSDATVAYNNLAGQACNTNLTGQDLGGLTLTPGVYCFDTSAFLTGTLTLDAQGNPSAVFIFQMGSTLTTASNSSVVLINGAVFCNVFFQVGSSATLGTGTSFQGNILALASITLTTGVTLNGRAIALTEAVTLDSNAISIEACSPTAASASIGGRVTTADGRGIPRVTIRMIDGDGGPVRMALTSQFGYYVFNDVPVGGVVVLEARHRRYSFVEPTLFISFLDEMTSANFVAY